jgi:excisionase family DNA binding protein
MSMDEEMLMTANTHFLTTGKAPPSGPKHIPFGERPTCSVDEATKACGLSRSMIYNKMKSGEIEWTKIGARRLIKVSSLLRLLGVG